MRQTLSAATLLLTFYTAVPAASAESFPPVTAGERALIQVPGHPEAPAVMLFRRGELDLVRHQLSSVLKVEARLKILTEKGKEDYGEIELLHHPWVRLRNLEGRTVLPDGTEVPLSKEGVFERRASRSRRLQVTAVAFPALEVGAVVDYRFELYFDSIYYLEPWVFQQEIPVLHSEIVYRIPKQLAARTWSRDPMRVGLETEQIRSALGQDLVVRARDLPPIPDEPHSFPAVDLAARFMLVPVNWGGRDPLLETWRSTCALVEEGSYRDARRNNTAARRLAGKLVQDAGGSHREKAQALYRFVRDKIETLFGPGVVIGEKQGPDTVIADRRGDSADKAFLLQNLLDAVKIDADLVWAASRRDGIIDLEVPSFGWFDRVLVRAELAGETVFLDPSEPGLAFGRLASDYEGTPAVVFHPRKPEVITLPTTAYTEHQRQARVELTLDAGGRLSGEGSLTLTGHHATRWIAARREEGKAPDETWSEWLGERFTDFEIREVAAEEEVDQNRAGVTWKMEQRPEEVLGDEVTLAPSRPLGPARQPLTLPPHRRRTPVMFEFGKRERLELTLKWDEGWELEARPEERRHDNGAGTLDTSLQVGENGRSVTYTRTFELRHSQFMGADDYPAAQSLFDAAEKSDAQDLVLVRQ